VHLELWLSIFPYFQKRSGQKIQLNLEKLTKGWWTKLLTSENKHLNTSNLQIEQHVEDMTSVDKMAIEEVCKRPAT